MSLHRFPLPTNHTQRNIHCIYFKFIVTVYKKAIAFRQSNYLTHMRYTEYVLVMTSVILPKYKILHEECIVTISSVKTGWRTLSYFGISG